MTRSRTLREGSPLGGAERQRRYRQRLKAAGRIEVRGIYAPRELHPEIRAAARRIVSGTADRVRRGGTSRVITSAPPIAAKQLRGLGHEPREKVGI